MSKSFLNLQTSWQTNYFNTDQILIQIYELTRISR
jgi:hypothetical protein